MEVSVRKDSARKRLQLIRFGSIILMKIEPRIPWHLQKKNEIKKKKEDLSRGNNNVRKKVATGRIPAGSVLLCLRAFSSLFQVKVTVGDVVSSSRITK